MMFPPVFPTAAPQKPKITGLSRSTNRTNLVVTWIHDVGGVATTYYITINTTGYTSAMVNTSAAGMTSYTYTFTNLNDSQVYKVTAMASNCAGTSTSDSYTEGKGSICIC